MTTKQQPGPGVALIIAAGILCPLLIGWVVWSGWGKFGMPAPRQQPPPPGPNDTLLNRSVRLPAVPEEDNAGSCWISDREMVVLRPVRQRPGFRLWRLDLQRGDLLPLDRLNDRLAGLNLSQTLYSSPDGDRGGSPARPASTTPLGDGFLSPDGRWLLARSGDNHGPGVWAAASLDGSRWLEWPETPPQTPTNAVIGSAGVWMSDRRRWVELVQEYVRGRYLFTSAVIRDVSAPAAAPEKRPLNASAGRIIGFMPDGRLLVYRYSFLDKPRSVELFCLALDGSRRCTRRRVSLPGGGVLAGTALSPKGDRLAWTVTDNGNLRHWITVSDPRGAGMREIGAADTQTERYTDQPELVTYHSPENLSWTPDGRALTFRFFRSMYRAPVE